MTLQPGIQIVVTPLLPIHPTPGQDARRIVRHGMADILDWLGEPVEPKPGEPTHTVLAADNATSSGGPILYASQEYADRIRRAATP